jgi:hypothetical protein
MGAHWSDAYVGEPYVKDTLNCGGWANVVQREVFGRDINLPTAEGSGPHAASATIKRLKDDYAERTDDPRDGDGVIMIGRGGLDHVGVYCVIHGEPWVLHAMKRVGQVVRTRLWELPNIGLKVEGFYQWK